MKKLSAVIVYFVLWLVAVIAQVLILGVSGTTPPIWSMPKMYYSILFLDVYLIVLFYINYFGLASYMVRKRLFKEYVFCVVVSALIGFVLPIGLFSAFGWSMPGVSQGSVPVSSLGPLGAVAVMAIGLAARALLEWVSLSSKIVLSEEKNKSLEKDLATFNTKVSELESELKSLKEAKKTEIEAPQQEM